MKRTRAPLYENAWAILTLFGCGGNTTEKPNLVSDGSVGEPPPVLMDSGAVSTEADATMCSSPTVECAPGWQLVAPNGGCPECVRCNYSQCVAPACELGSVARVRPNRCCTECEKQRCPSVDYMALAPCGVEVPARSAACEFMLSRPPPDSMAVTVLVNCAATTGVRYGDGGAIVAGDWEIDFSTSPLTLRIVGPLCDLLATDGTARLDVMFGCPVI